MMEVFVKLGIKNTRSRRLVYELFSAQQRPLSAQGIAELLHGEVTLSTIYRTLELFVEKGLIVKTMAFNGVNAEYERRHEEHRHSLVCTSCGAVTYFAACPVHAISERLEAETGYTIRTHRLELTGLCGTCRKGEASDTK